MSLVYAPGWTLRSRAGVDTAGGRADLGVSRHVEADQHTGGHRGMPGGQWAGQSTVVLRCNHYFSYLLFLINFDQSSLLGAPVAAYPGEPDAPGMQGGHTLATGPIGARGTARGKRHGREIP